ncbi:MAG TPA: hypothetical protein VGK87_01560, partial [Anaerolineae bacterium]
MKAQLQKTHAGNLRRNRMVGFAFGLCFGLAGAIAPFVLSEGSDNPDARFLMIIGFSPVAISGAIMVILFAQTLWAASPAAKASDINRLPSPGSDTRSDTVAASLAMVAIVSGVLLSLCAVVIPIISSGSMHTGIGVPSAV